MTLIDENEDRGFMGGHWSFHVLDRMRNDTRLMFVNLMDNGSKKLRTYFLILSKADIYIPCNQCFSGEK